MPVYFRIIIPSNIFNFFGILFFLIASNADIFGQTTYYTRVSGPWNSPSTWSTVNCGSATVAATYPQAATDNVVICDQVFINADIEVNDVTVRSGGILTYESTVNRTISTLGTFSVLTGGAFMFNSNNARSHSVVIKGNLSNAGTIDLYSDADDFVNLSFEGAATNVVTGGGTWSLYGVMLNKSSKSAIAEIQSTQFYSNFNGASWTYTMGTYYHNNIYAFNLANTGTFTLPSDCGIKLSTGTLNFASASGYLALKGRLEILSGTINIGQAAGAAPNGILYSAGVAGIVPELIVSGGTINVFQGVSYESSATDPFSFLQTGGTLNLNSGTAASDKELLRVNDVATSVFAMSGGTVVFHQKNTGALSDFAVCGTNGTVNSTGGTLQFGDATAVSQTFNFTPYPNAVLPNVKITGPVAQNIILKPFSTGDFKFMSLYIDEGKTFDMSHNGNATDVRKMSLTSTYDGSITFFDNNSGATNYFIPRNGTVVINGNANQILKRTSGNEIFYALQMNNTGGDLILNSALNVTNQVIFTVGKIVTTNATKLIFNAGATNTGASNASYVSGPVQRFGSGAFDFPVGNGGVFRAIGISPAGVATDAFTAEYFFADPDPLYSTSSKGTGVDQLSHCEYWNLNQDVGTTGTKVKLYYGTGSCDLAEYSSFKVAYWNGSQWTDQGRGSGSGNATAGYTQSSVTCTTFGPFTIISCRTPTISASGPTTFCSGNSITLTSSSPSNNTWNTGATSQAIVVTTSGSYYVTTNLGGCNRNSTTQIITVNPLPANPTGIDASRCGSGAVSLGASGSTGTYYWYNVPSGGSLLVSGPTYPTSLTTTTVFYVTAVSGSGCESPRVAVTANINSFPASPVGKDSTRCGTGILNLSASGSSEYNWYDAITGGPVIHTTAYFPTSPLSVTTSYYVSAVSLGCESITRTKVTGFVNAIPADPVGRDSSRCGNGSVMLSATGATSSFNWYDSNVSSSPLASATQDFLTPAISATRNFFVVSVSMQGCESARIPVKATIKTTPSNPIIIDGERCGPGSVYLTVSNSPDAYNWYKDSTGGVSLSTLSYYNTDSILVTTLYYVSSISSAKCESPRVAIKASIQSIPSIPIPTNNFHCGKGIVNLSASGSSASYKWYADSLSVPVLETNASFNTPILNATDSFYVSAVSGVGCESKRIKVIATIFTIPTVPDGKDNFRCGNGQVLLSANGSPDTYKWYDSNSSTPVLVATQDFLTPAITSTRDFFVVSVSKQGCESARIAVTATIHTIPADPIGKDSARCGPGSIYLSASGLAPKFIWYMDGSTTTSLDTNSFYITDSILVTRQYFVSSLSLEGCKSTRIPVNAVIQTIPGIPQPKDSARCGKGIVHLSASGSPASYRWYQDMLTSTIVGRNDTFNPFISSTVKFYVSAVSSAGCESKRKEANATMYDLPVAPSGKDGAKCGAGKVQLSASGTLSGYKWYDSDTSKAYLDTVQNFLTPVISSTRYFYSVAVSLQGCESSRVPVNAVINGIPGNPSVKDSSRCGPGIVYLSASGSPSTYLWYADSTGGSLPETNDFIWTDSLQNSTFYYVSAYSKEKCESKRVPVKAVIQTIPNRPFPKDSSRCGVGSVYLSASGSVYGYKWYVDSLVTTVIASKDTFLTPSLEASKKYFVAAVSSAGCESMRISANAFVYDIPVSPTGIAGERCGKGKVELSATGSPDKYKWYEIVTGTALASTIPYTTPDLNATTDFKVVSVSSHGCESGYTTVTATINPIPVAPNAADSSRCGPGKLLLSASNSPFKYNWYLIDSGGASVESKEVYSTDSLPVTTAFYVSSISEKGCESIREKVNAVIHTIPQIPSVKDNSRCGTGKVVLMAAGAQAGYRWYGAESAASVIGNEDTFTTEAISQTSVFYVTALSNEGCESKKTKATATIYAVPASPTASNNSRCGEGEIYLSAAADPSLEYRWYADDTTTISLSKTFEYTTPSISTSKLFYVASRSLQGCESSRISVNAIVNAFPQKPQGKDASRCGPGFILLAASGSPGTYNWYPDANSDSLLESGQQFNPDVSATRSFFVSAVSNEGCENVERASVIATIYEFPSPPHGIDSARCGPGKVILSCSGLTTLFRWYQESSGGPKLDSGVVFKTAFINKTTAYYVSAVSPQGCENNLRSLVTATIELVPELPLVVDSSRCGPGVLGLSASNTTDKFGWYMDSLGGNIVEYRNVFKTDTLDKTKVYYVSSVGPNGCESSRVPVTAYILDVTRGGSLSSDTSVCEGENFGRLTLKGYRGSIIRWESSTNNFTNRGTTIQDTTAIYDFKNISQRTTFRVIVQNTICAAISSGWATIEIKPSVNVGILHDNDYVIKGENNGTLNLSGYTGSIKHWEVSNDNFTTAGVVADSNATLDFNNLTKNTSYRVFLQTPNCASKYSNSILITVKQLPIAEIDSLRGELNESFTSPQSILLNDISPDGDQLSVLPVHNMSTYGGGLIDINQNGDLEYHPKAGFVGIDSVEYSACIANIPKQICKTSKLYFIIRDEALHIFPTISPNEDNINDEWTIDNITKFANNQVSIYDRWGNLVFEEKGYNNQSKVFKGISNKGMILGSKELTDGTYFYIIDMGDGSRQRSGYLVLKR